MGCPLGSPVRIYDETGPRLMLLRLRYLYAETSLVNDVSDDKQNECYN